jgi:integrase
VTLVATPVTVHKRCACPAPTKCRCEWHFYFRLNGARQRGSLLRETGENPATMTEATAAADTIRRACVEGLYVWARDRRAAAPAAPVIPAVPPSAPLLADLIAQFDLRVIAPSATAPNTKISDRAIFKRFAAFAEDGASALGTRPVDTITEDTIEAFFIALDEDEVAISTRNKYVTQINKLWRWAYRKRLVGRSPLSGEADLIRRRKHAERHRRVRPELEARIIAAARAAGTLLVVLIPALIETGCRLGELRALQWRDVVDGYLWVAARELGARKSGRRGVPISSVLQAILEARRHDGHGDPFPPDAYVFGDERGGTFGSVHKAWETAVLKAHGITPGWTATHALDRKTRKALDHLDLHLHDLRHEAGHRWLEGGVPLNAIQALYGHATLTQTSTYLGIDTRDLAGALQRYESTRHHPGDATGPEFCPQTVHKPSTRPALRPRLVHGAKTRSAGHAKG